jgi:hypothetical protein
VREHAELNDETLLRARLVAERADIVEAVRAIDSVLTRRSAAPRDSSQGRTSHSRSRG